MTTFEMLLCLQHSKSEATAARCHAILNGFEEIEQAKNITGSFMTAVLNGDYDYAIRLADEANREALTNPGIITLAKNDPNLKKYESCISKQLDPAKPLYSLFQKHAADEFTSFLEKLKLSVEEAKAEVEEAKAEVEQRVKEAKMQTTFNACLSGLCANPNLITREGDSVNADSKALINIAKILTARFYNDPTFNIR